MENIKHANHYVFRHYLQAWETDGRLSCLIDGKVKRINAVNLAVENDFYHLPILNDAEIAFVKRAAELMPERGHKVNQNFIKAFVILPHLQGFLSNDPSNNAELSAALRTYKANAEEDWHARIESLAVPILDSIKKGDISFYTDTESSMHFMYFLALQLVRTKKIRDAQIGFNVEHGIDLAKVGQITAHFTANNLGANLFLRRHDDPITLIINHTDIGLITSDQPVVNLYAGDNRASTQLAVYYPVSPTTAILFGDIESTVSKPTWFVGAEQVRTLNNLMMQQSYKMSFARHKGDFA